MLRGFDSRGRGSLYTYPIYIQTLVVYSCLHVRVCLAEAHPEKFLLEHTAVRHFCFGNVRHSEEAVPG